MKDVYIVGAKGIGQYGGYETFVQKLIQYSKGINFHIACKANGDGHMDIKKTQHIKYIDNKHFMFFNAECFLVSVIPIGHAQAILYDLKSLLYVIRDIEKKKIKEPIIYVLACRIGPFFRFFVKRIHSLNGKVYINPDGHEWKRAKWNKIIQIYWKESEKMMVKNADLIVCDSKSIEKYIQKEYSTTNTTFIAYGSEAVKHKTNDSEWLKKYNLVVDNYYLSVGRCVPENNYETMIREFIKSKTNKKYVIISNVNSKFLKELDNKTKFSKDSRIQFVGTEYDAELLKKIREDAYGYIHGHEVGGTNPSLLEALNTTKINLLLNVSFNKEVAEDTALYWTKEEGNLSFLINTCENIDRTIYENKAKKRMKSLYNWQLIADKYEKIFK